MTSNAGVKPGSPAARRVAEAVAANPGCQVHEIAGGLAWSVKHCSKALTGAKKTGLIAMLRFGGTTKWYPVDAVGEVRQEAIERSTEKARRLKRLRNHKYSRQKDGSLLDDFDLDDFDVELSDTPIRRWVGCGEPLPFVCRAPNSVFALGATT